METFSTRAPWLRDYRFTDPHSFGGQGGSAWHAAARLARPPPPDRASPSHTNTLGTAPNAEMLPPPRHAAFRRCTTTAPGAHREYPHHGQQAIGNAVESGDLAVPMAQRHRGTVVAIASTFTTRFTCAARRSGGRYSAATRVLRPLSVRRIPPTDPLAIAIRHPRIVRQRLIRVTYLQPSPFAYRRYSGGSSECQRATLCSAKFTARSPKSAIAPTGATAGSRPIPSRSPLSSWPIAALSRKLATQLPRSGQYSAAAATPQEIQASIPPVSVILLVQSRSLSITEHHRPFPQLHERVLNGRLMPCVVPCNALNHYGRSTRAGRRIEWLWHRR